MIGINELIIHQLYKFLKKKMSGKKERLGPRHPDWVWLRSPDEVILAERAQPFDSKVSRESQSNLLGGRSSREVFVPYFGNCVTAKGCSNSSFSQQLII